MVNTLLSQHLMNWLPRYASELDTSVWIHHDHYSAYRFHLSYGLLLYASFLRLALSKTVVVCHLSGMQSFSNGKDVAFSISVLCGIRWCGRGQNDSAYECRFDYIFTHSPVSLIRGRAGFLYLRERHPPAPYFLSVVGYYAAAVICFLLHPPVDRGRLLILKSQNTVCSTGE